MTSLVVRPANGGRAATISYSTTPSDQTSVRASTVSRVPAQATYRVPCRAPFLLRWQSAWQRRVRIVAHQLGQAEVQHLHQAVGPEDDVLRLHVAMHHVGRVRRAQCRRDLDADVEHLPQWHPAACQARRRVCPSMCSMTMKC